jgi:hypothetical protein
MNTLFAALLRRGVLIFMDDILIYSANLEDHVKLVRLVFEILNANKFYIIKSKCSFAQASVEYLGHIVSAAGVATEPSKIEAMLSWSKPENLKQLRGFLGLTGYYRKFTQYYGLIS